MLKENSSMLDTPFYNQIYWTIMTIWALNPHQWFLAEENTANIWNVMLPKYQNMLKSYGIV